MYEVGVVTTKECRYFLKKFTEYKRACDFITKCKHSTKVQVVWYNFVIYGK